MQTVRQASEFFRFELRQQLRHPLRHPSFWISLVACIAAGVAFAATGMGDLEVAAGRVPDNVPYAVLRNLAGLSAIGMFVVMVSVAKLIFSRPVRTTGYLIGRFAGGTCIGMIAVLVGAVAMLLTQGWLASNDALMAPVSLEAWSFGVWALVLPNLLLISSLIYLLALFSRSMGMTFLGLLLIIIGQDLAEIIPVGQFGYRLPALMDPLGLAAMNSVTHNWTVSDYATRFPGLEGDLLWNRLLWISLTVLFGLLAAPVFAKRARRADAGEKRKAMAAKEKPERTPVANASAAAAHTPTAISPTHSARKKAPSSRARLWWTQCTKVLRFEFRCLTSSLAWRVLLVLGIAVAFYAATQGNRLIGVLSVPGASSVLFAVDRSARVVMTLMVVLFSGELVWRERSTRMGLTLDAMPIGRGVLITGKMMALATLVAASIGMLGLAAWISQTAMNGPALAAGDVLIPVLHETLLYLQIAAVAVLLQVLAGGQMRGYLATALFLALRLGLRATENTGVHYSIASVRLPFQSAMNGWGFGMQRVVLTHSYWILVATVAILIAGLFWPHGEALSPRASITQARRRFTGRIRTATFACLLGVLISGAWIGQSTLASGTGWSAKQVEAYLADYEKEFRSWSERPRPQVVAITADVDLDPADRRVSIEGSYRLRNHHPQAVKEMLLNFDPDFRLLTCSLGSSPADVPVTLLAAASAVPTAAYDSPHIPGTRILRFEPPLQPGASVELKFDLLYEPQGWGARPADRWLVENGSFLLGGTGTHPFFLGGHVFPSLGYDSARELRSRKARARFGLEPWAPLMTASAYEQTRSGSGYDPVFGSSDWAHVDLWIHTPEDQTALAPGTLLERSISDGRAHHHFRTPEKIQAFFSILSGRYEKVTARQGDVEIEIHHHAEHEERVAHIQWAVQRSLAYFEQHWGPYPHDTLRLGEIPGEAGFAASFPGVMGFGESMAFTCPRGDGFALEFPDAGSDESSAEDVDPILWIVAHEVAHQWWDCHVLPGLALGASFTSESLAQYGSLAVVHAEYGEEVTKRMAQHSLNVYLQQRGRAGREERALVDVDDQAYLHYEKGLYAFHAMAQVAGYAPIDRALAQLAKLGGADGMSITSVQLMQALRSEWPEEQLPMLEELLERIAFVESSIVRAEVRELPASLAADRSTSPAARAAHSLSASSFSLLVEATVTAVHADGDGAEQPFDYEGDIELQVQFGEGQGRQRLTAPVVNGQVRFEHEFTTRPTHVHLDPRLLHIDRNLNDNEAIVLEKTP
ncbi:MAG: hypothetical protein ACYTEP_12420 [Planctomycetota bacterium]